MTTFLDTNIAVYAHDHGSGPKQAAASALLEELAESLVVSTQVLAEFFWTVTRRLDPPLDQGRAGLATEALATLPVVPTDASLVLAAIDTAEGAGISLWDAMIVEAAVRAGCDEIVTEDLSHGQEIRGVTIRNPFAPA